MMKRSFLLAAAILFCVQLNSQIQYSNCLGNLSLQSYTAASVITQYTTIPAGFSLINDGHNNNAGTTTIPNAPFHVPSLKTTGWATIYNAAENDTFLVSTSWLDTTSITADRWIITPTVTNISANTVLTWLAKSPDTNYPDGYEVYGTNKTGTLVAGDFTAGDRLFTLTDGHTQGGGEKNNWTRHSINLSAFAGQTMRFAFRNNSTNMFQLWIDDIEVKTFPLNLDGAITSIQTEKYFLIDSAQTVSVTYSNNAAATINSITLNYQFGTSSPITQVFTSTAGIGYGQAKTYTFGLTYSFSSPGYYPVKAWATLPNNLNDQNPANDTIYTYVTVQTASPQKNVLAEQFLSANDPESPDAQQKLLALESPSVIIVNIHDNDSLKEINSAGVLAYRKQFSTAMIDRFYNDSIGRIPVTRAFYSTKLNQRLRSVTPASVNIVNKTYNSGTRQLSFTVKADFVGEVKGDYRLNAYLVENNVSGKASDTTVNSYNQLNDYFNVPWSPYYQTGYFSFAVNSWVLNAWQFKHQRVLIHSFSGSFGLAGIIPQTGGTQDQSYQVTYSMTIPTATNGISKYNEDNIHIVAFVSEYNTDANKRNILNVVQNKLNSNSEVVGIKETVSDLKISLHPNPSAGILYLNGLAENRNYEIRMFDLLGKCIFSTSVKNSYMTEKIDISGIPEGVYILNLSSEGKNYREKIVKQNN